MITRKEIVAKYKIAAKKVKQLESKKYEYKTNRACEPFGLVQNMNIDDVVRAGASVHDGDANITARIEQYGVRPDDLKNCSARKFLGFTIDTWDNDFKLRVEEIHDKKELAKYKLVMYKFLKNFNDDDRFALEMSEIDDLDIDLNDTVDEPVDMTEGN